MRIPVSWLREYVDAPTDPAVLEPALVKVGLEVEALTDLRAASTRRLRDVGGVSAEARSATTQLGLLLHDDSALEAAASAYLGSLAARAEAIGAAGSETSIAPPPLTMYWIVRSPTRTL